MEGSPLKRTRTQKTQREVVQCSSVRELYNLTHGALVAFTGALIDLSDLRHVDTSKGRKPVCGLQLADSDGIVSVSAWEQPAVLLSAQAARALDESKDASFPKVVVKALLVDKQQGSGGALKLTATADSAVQVLSTIDLKIMPHSSMVSGDFNEIVDKRASCTSAQFVTHLQGQVTKLDELGYSKNNTAMRRGVLTDENGRSLQITYMSQIAEEFQAEVGDIVTVFYGHIKGIDKRDGLEPSGNHMVWAYQDSYVLKLGKAAKVRISDVML